MRLVEDTLPITGISDDLLMEVERAVPCQIGTVMSQFPECPNEPRFLVLFRDVCAHGADITPGDPLVCGSHAAWMVAGEYCCGSCGCMLSKTIEGWHHMIIKFQEI